MAFYVKEGSSKFTTIIRFHSYVKKFLCCDNMYKESSLNTGCLTVFYDDMNLFSALTNIFSWGSLKSSKVNSPQYFNGKLRSNQSNSSRKHCLSDYLGIYNFRSNSSPYNCKHHILLRKNTIMPIPHGHK